MLKKIRNVARALLLILMVIFVSNNKGVAFNGIFILFFLMLSVESAWVNFREKKKVRLVFDGIIVIAFVVVLIMWTASVIKHDWAGIF